VPSASVTATTVFQGLNNNANESFNMSLAKPRDASVDNGVLTSSFQAQMNNLVNDSPITMMDMSDDKGNRLIGNGDQIVRGGAKPFALNGTMTSD